MKRNVVMLILMVVALCSFGAPPKLACESIFDRKDIRTEGNKIVCTKSVENYYRCVSSDKNPKLRDEIIKLVEKDKARACNVVETYKNGQEGVILNIENNGQMINVGLRWTEDGYVNLFVQGVMAAFE